MMAGLLGGILLYRPIFSEFLRVTDTSGKHIIYENDTRKTSTRTEINNKTKDTLSIFTIYNEDSFKKGIRVDIAIVDTHFANHANYDAAMLNDPGAEGGYNIKFGQQKHINKRLAPNLYWKFVFLVWIMILFVTMAYGPVAAFLVELFPTKIRYTSMSLPYHIGNGVFGGLVPFIGLLLTTTYPADPLVGLWYPIGVAALCFVIGVMYLNNKIDKNIND